MSETMREKLRRAYFTAEGYDFDKLDHYDPVPKMSDADETIDAILAVLAEPDDWVVRAALEAFTNRWPTVSPSTDMIEETISAAINHIREGGEET